MLGGGGANIIFIRQLSRRRRDGVAWSEGKRPGRSSMLEAGGRGGLWENAARFGDLTTEGKRQVGPQ